MLPLFYLRGFILFLLIPPPIFSTVLYFILFPFNVYGSTAVKKLKHRILFSDISFVEVGGGGGEVKSRENNDCSYISVLKKISRCLNLILIFFTCDIIIMLN